MAGRNYELHRERAARAWPLLVQRVKLKPPTLTYKELGNAIGVHYRAVSYALSEIQGYCKAKNIPALQALVVSGGGSNAGLPGPGYAGSPRTSRAHRDELQKIRDHPWSLTPPDFD